MTTTTSCRTKQVEKYQQAATRQAFIVTTTGLIADLVRDIAGSRFRVASLMGPGVDPHLYKPTASDVKRLRTASLIFYNGLHLEGKMSDMLRKFGHRKRVVAVAEHVSKKKLRQTSSQAGRFDPHIWFDVSLWAETVDVIAHELIRLSGKSKKTITDNAQAVKQKLAALDQWVEGQIASIPKTRRILVTAHDAFGYFGQRYNIRVEALQGVSTAAQAGIRDMERLVKLIVTRKIPSIFVEASVPKRTIIAVQQACLAQGHRVRIGGKLFSDSMGAASTPEGTYLGMVKHNVRTIVGELR